MRILPAILLLVLIGFGRLYAMETKTAYGAESIDTAGLAYNNALMVAPLDHFLSGSKSSIYYKRIFHKRAGGQRLMLRIGTEGMGSILSRFSTRESGVDVYNLKLGFEWDFNFNGFHFYFGPEIGQSRYETDEGSLRVLE